MRHKAISKTARKEDQYMTEKDNLEKGSGDREDQGRVGNLECGLSNNTEPQAYHHMISLWQNR